MAKGESAKTTANEILLAATTSAQNLSWCEELSPWGKELLNELVSAAAAINPTPQVTHLAREFIKETGISRSVSTVSRKLKEMIDAEKASPKVRS